MAGREKVHMPPNIIFWEYFYCAMFVSLCHAPLFNLQNDEKMNEVMNLAHTFLQNFCRGNPQNQVLLHKHLNLFLTPGVSTLVTSNIYSKVSIKLILAALMSRILWIFITSFFFLIGVFSLKANIISIKETFKETWENYLQITISFICV